MTDRCFSFCRLGQPVLIWIHNAPLGFWGDGAPVPYTVPHSRTPPVSPPASLLLHSLLPRITQDKTR